MTTPKTTMLKNRSIPATAIFAIGIGLSLPLQAGVIKGSFTVNSTSTSTYTSATSTATSTHTGTQTSSSKMDIRLVQKGKSVDRLVIKESSITDYGSYTRNAKSTSVYHLSKRAYGGTVARSFVDSDGDSGSETFADGGPSIVKVQAKKKRGKIRGGRVVVTLKQPWSDTYSSTSGGSSYTDNYNGSSTRRITAKIGKKSSIAYLGNSSYNYRYSNGDVDTGTTTEKGSGKARGKITR